VKVPFKKILLVMLAGIALYAVWAVYSGVSTLAAVLASFDWLAFAGACALAFGNYVLRFFKWEFYLARLDIRGVGKLDSFLTFLSGFVLTVTPGKVGEVFKSLVLFETHAVPIATTAPIVIAERVTDLIGIIVLILAGSTVFPGGGLWAGIGSVLVLSVLVVISSRRISLAIVDFAARLPGPVGGIAPKLRHAFDSLTVLVHPRNLVVPALLSVVAWFLECLSLWVILRGFGQDVSVALCTFFYATSTLAGAIIPVPGGLGVTEGALREQLQTLGKVIAPVATASMMLVRFATLWFAVLVGFVALSLLKRRHPSLLTGNSTNATSPVPLAGKGP
jgi:uncharacterized membrane protein YbhN (UPF0104 family)